MLVAHSEPVPSLILAFRKQAFKTNINLNILFQRTPAFTLLENRVASPIPLQREGANQFHHTYPS